MGIRQCCAVLAIIIAASSWLQWGDACGAGVALEFRATQSSHRLQVNSVGKDLMFLMVFDSGYQVGRVPDVSVTKTSETSTSVVLSASNGATLTIAVVQDTPSLYLVKVSWTNLKSEIWDCKELSKEE